MGLLEENAEMATGFDVKLTNAARVECNDALWYDERYGNRQNVGFLWSKKKRTRKVHRLLQSSVITSAY